MRPVLAFMMAFYALSFSSIAQGADFFNLMQKKVEEQLSGQSPTSVSSLSNSQIISGLREALKVGTRRVIDQVGQSDGYNQDPAIHIPLPGELQDAKNLLSKFGLSSIADDVELRLNRAAEQAAPKAKDVIIKAITDMSLQDAKAIYNGPNDAATQYFKKVSNTELRRLISPVVQDSLQDVGAIVAYDNLVGQYQSMPFVPDVKANLINHTTTLAIDGIFHYLAQEEAAIRENPAKRTTEILKTVFGK